MTDIQCDKKNANFNNEIIQSKADEYYRGLSSALKKSAKEYGPPEEVRKLYYQDSIEAEHRVADLNW